MAEEIVHEGKTLKELKREVTCGICQEHYTEPKILPCLHYYCKECILRLAFRTGKNRPFSCPECHSEATLPEGGVDELKTAFFINRIESMVTMLMRIHGKIEVTCEACMSGSKAEAFCHQCARFLCSECVKLHYLMKIFSNHSVSSLEDLKQGKTKPISVNAPIKPQCRVHLEPLSIYCFDCDTPICHLCTVKDHREHNFKFYEEADEEADVSTKEFTGNTRTQSDENIAAKDAEPQDFFSNVMKAVAKSQTIKKKMANIILQGLPGSGKTLLLDRLLNRSIRLYYCSTGVSDAIVIVDISPSSTLSAAQAYEDSTWKVIDFDKSLITQLDSCMEFLPGHIKQGSLVTVGRDHQELDTDMEELLHKIHLTSEVEGHVRTVLQKYDIKNIRDLQTTNSLYFRDTGGQVEFQESLSLLIYGPSIFIFVMKTNVDINTKHIIQYRSPTGEFINRYKSTISTVDALLQFLASVSAIQTTEEGVFQKDGIYYSHKPIVFIVGTHIDKLGSEASSKITKMNENLDGVIRSQNFFDLVHYADARLRKVMYVVNNTCTEDDNQFQLLRSAINKYISGRNEFTIEYPVSYLLFCLELQSIKETVITMEDCVELAAMFGIDRSNIKNLLQFLHFRVGIIQYYDVEGLSKLVIKEPQVLFNKVTDLLVKTFLSSDSLSASEQESFCEKGILDVSAFDNILSQEDRIEPKQFLCFLLHLRMAIPFTDKSGVLKYFIPSVLNHVQKASIKKKTDIAPLFITFEHGHCPKGLLGMMVSYLLNPDNSQKISFDLLEDDIYQDQVSLLAHSTEDVDEICIKQHLSHIEVSIIMENSFKVEESGASGLLQANTKRISALDESGVLAPRANTPSEVCSNIRTILQDSLQQSLKSLHYDLKKVGPAFCLSCPRENCFQQQNHHEVKKGKDFHYMHCRSDKIKLRLPKAGGHWFNEGTEDSSSLSRKSTEVGSDKGDSSPLYTKKVKLESDGISLYYNKCDQFAPTLKGAAAGLKFSARNSLSEISKDSAPEFSIQTLTLLKWTDSTGQCQSLRLCNEISAYWIDAGTLLKLSESRLKGIESKHCGDVRRCCRDVLSDWIQMDNGPYTTSWKGMLKLLEDMELKKLALKLKDALNR